MANRRKAWVYGPEKVTVAWNGLALDLTFYGSSKLTGRIECVEVGLRSIPDTLVPQRSAAEDLIRKPTGAPILASYFRAPGLVLALKIDSERRKLAKALRAGAERPISSAVRADPATGQVGPMSAARIEELRESARYMAAAAGSKAASRPRQRIDAALLSHVARVYRESYASTDRYRDPARAVAEHFDRAQRTTDRWIHAAREKGYLPKTRRGVTKA